MGFMPLGKQTQASLEATWPSPSFDGNFLPESRQVRADGFEARWKVLDLNRNYPHLFLDNTYSFQGSDFGVRFIQPANDYQKNTRTGKYALLVIGLTFLIFFFFEILRKTRIHPFQYLLVGLALVLFYMLVLSISEHLGFAGAYFIASAATIGLICGYGAFIMPPAKNALLLGVFLIAIYGFIYVVLQLEDYALLVGSLGLFAVLAAVMYLSRRVNWYGE
jgi:inner membrane protein